MNLETFNRSKKKNIVVGIVMLGLLAVGAFFAIQNYIYAKEMQKVQQELARQKTNIKIIDFLDLFIQKVLKTDKEIAFEDRLKLENSIRDINDPEILAKWEQFTGGTNEAEIQAGVKNLLEILVKKMY